MDKSAISTRCTGVKRKRNDDDYESKNIKSTKIFKDLPTEVVQDIMGRILEPYLDEALALENVPTVPDIVFRVPDPDAYLRRLKRDLVAINFHAKLAGTSESVSYLYQALQAKTKLEQDRVMRKMAPFVETARDSASYERDGSRYGRLKHRETKKWHGYKRQPLEWTFVKLGWLSRTLSMMQGTYRRERADLDWESRAHWQAVEISMGTLRADAFLRFDRGTDEYWSWLGPKEREQLVELATEMEKEVAGDGMWNQRLQAYADALRLLA